MNSSSQQKSDQLLVFVGSIIPGQSGNKNSEGYVNLKYRVIEKTYGRYDGDTINFLAHYDADNLKFTKYRSSLIFLLQKGGVYFKLALPVYDVYQTVDGRWASGAKSWDYDPELQTAIKPRPLNFKDSVSFELTNLSEDQKNHWYPVKYYERRGSVAIPILGSYTHELFEINKYSFLSSYFPFEKNFLNEEQIDVAISGWQKSGILNQLTRKQISAAKAEAIQNNASNLNDVIAYFPGVAYWFDTELENLKDPYAEFIRKLAEISHGAFHPKEIADNFDIFKPDVTVSFILNKKGYSRKFRVEGDWMDTRIVDFIKEVVKENKLEGQFYELYEGGQGGIIIYLTPEQYKTLKTKELVIFAEDR